MFSAAELIEFLTTRTRRRYPLYAERAFGEFPPAWRAWFLAIAERPDAVKGAPAADFSTLLLQREPRPVPRAQPVVGRWRAWPRLFRQQWDAAPRDQRHLRRIAGVGSVLLHCCFAIMLLWLGLVGIGNPPLQADNAGDDAIRVELIGNATPEEQGGGAAQGDRDAPAQAGGGAPRAAAAPPSTAASASAPPPVAETQPQSAPAAQASVEQPVAVTETQTPDPELVLPPPTPVEIAMPQTQAQVSVPALNSEDREIEALATPTAAPELRMPEQRTPVPTTRVPELRNQEAEIEMVQAPAVQAPALAQPDASAPQLQTPTLRAAVRDVEMRAPPAPVAGAGNAPSATSKANTSGNATGNGRATGAPSPVNGGSPAAQGAGRTTGIATKGAGDKPTPKPGGVPSPQRGDDWGASNRNVPGSTAGRDNGSGLLDGNGRARLPGDGGNVGGGLPPGTIIEDFEKIDRMGTWLKRPPIDYTPTRFDRFWIPRETLLEEWVRRGVKTVRIPIPGTTKRIECTVSLLQAGGGCRVTDPNLQDQEATARKPPDVPFKPELQEDQNVLLRPAPAAPPSNPQSPPPKPKP